MKTKMLMLTYIFVCSLAYSQDSIQLPKSGFITFSPKKDFQKNTNGINLGILDDYQQEQKINGINLQLNPILVIYPLIPKAIDAPKKEVATVTVNGIHISTSGMFDGKNLNGLGISVYHHAYETNGVAVNFYNNTSVNLNGLHVSGFANNSDKGRGVNISIMGNYSKNFQGLMMGAFNETNEVKGIQIGISNKTKKLKGVQLGLWNKNEKRNFPIINWNFKKSVLLN